MLKILGCTLIAVGLSSTCFAQTSQEKGLAIAVEADKRDLGWVDSTADMKMILRNKNGDESIRSLRVNTLEVKDDGDKSLTIFDEPADVRGTALLTYSHKTGSDDQWLYLPALKRVKRIASSNKSGPFMGSEFAFEDLSSQEVEKYTYNYLRDEACGSLTCFVIERFPIDEDSGYTKQIAWLDQQEYRVQKVEYYDRKKSLLKTLEPKDYKQYLGQYWRANDSNMVNHQTGKSTQLIWSDFKFKTGLDEGDFSQNSLKRAR
ncbi:MAG: outer membrane lipoprotein-sorting protein [Hahellaceae bacterium]|jgi:outer membrane lipoprotein-sorting protein|nr:outer membrane lipoprotein-sorting protein [Hahellaceae bacterium]MCP5213171.1 outer membrane lipoprotein-sorting protein [Hahellaceae bacterium]